MAMNHSSVLRCRKDQRMKRKAKLYLFPLWTFEKKFLEGGYMLVTSLNFKIWWDFRTASWREKSALHATISLWHLLGCASSASVSLAVMWQSYLPCWSHMITVSTRHNETWKSIIQTLTDEDISKDIQICRVFRSNNATWRGLGRVYILVSPSVKGG